MKKHLKYIDGSSDKFWQIEVLETAYIVTYGKNGTSGTSQTKTFADNPECLKAAEKLLNEKIKKGYSESGEVTINNNASGSSKNSKGNVQEILDAYDDIVKSRNIDALLPFLKENSKGNIEALKKQIKNYRRYWMTFIDLEKEPKFKKDNYPWGTRGDEKQKKIITLSAIALFNKTDITAWDEAYEILGKAEEPLILEFLNWAQPAWITSFLLEKQKKDRWRTFDYKTLRFLESNSLITFLPELYALSISTFNWGHGIKTRDYIDLIVNDEVAYKRDIPELFNYETSIHSHYFRDNDSQAYNQFGTWEIIYNTLIKEQKLDRNNFIEQTILIQTKDWNNSLKSFFRKRLTDLEPTAAELIPFQEHILSSLQYAYPPIVNASIDLVKKIYDNKKFDVTSFLDWAEPMMISSDNKASIKNILPIFDKLNKSHPKLNKKITSLIADIYVIPDLNLQEKATKLILKIASVKDSELIEKLSGYAELMQGNVRAGLKGFLNEDVFLAESNEKQTYHYAPIKEKVLLEPLQLPKDWNDIVFLFGKFIASDEVADAELLFNTYITQRDLFSDEYWRQLEPYRLQLEKKYFESTHKSYISVFLQQKINANNSVFRIQDSPYVKVKTLLLIKPILHAVQNRISSQVKLPMLSFPTHHPYWISPKVLVERLIAYQKNGEEVNKLDLSIAIGRMPREQVENAIPLLDQLKGELKDLMTFSLGVSKKITLKSDTVFTKLLSTIGKATDPNFKGVWAVAARTYYPEETFPEFEDTYLKHVPFAVMPFRPEIKINERWNEFVNYQTKKKEKSPSWYEISYDVPGYMKIPDYFLFGLDLYGRKNSWEYLLRGEGNVNFWHSLMPQNADALSFYLLRSSCSTSNGGGQELTGFLNVVNGSGFQFSETSMLVYACMFFQEKKELRLMAAEVMINLIEKQKIDLELFAAKAAYLASNKYGAFLRLVESTGILKDVSPMHNSAFLKVLEGIFKNLVIAEKLPVNFKKMVEHYIDILYKTGEKPAAESVVFFERWKDNAAMKPLIKQILA